MKYILNTCLLQSRIQSRKSFLGNRAKVSQPSSVTRNDSLHSNPKSSIHMPRIM